MSSPLTFPTLLTLIRVGLIPVLVVVFYTPWEGAPSASAVIFALAAVTDWLDGYLARRFDQTSAFGEFLDPVADKLMVAVALVLLVERDPSSWLAVAAAVIICREILVSALREWMAELGKRASVAVSILGKLKTVLQMLAIVLLLYRDMLFGLPVYALGSALLVAAAGLTLWSMAVYVLAAWPDLFVVHEREHLPAPPPAEGAPRE